MKTLAASLFALTFAAASSFAGGFGPGPWANATYYPGNLDGKYQAAVFGANISGVLGFALRDGAPPTTVTSQIVNTNSSQSSLRVDPFLNYFAIFVEGRTYTGLTTAGVNYNNNTVTGALVGTQPDFRLTTNSFNTFTTNTSVNATFEIDRSIFVLVTNVTPTVTVIGQTNIITTNNTPITNIFTTNLLVIQTNVLVGTNTILQTNTNTGVVTETNIPFITSTFSTNVVIATVTNTSAPEITTNSLDVLVTNFTTNITSQSAGFSSNSPTLLTNTEVSTIANPYTWFDPAPLLNRGLNGGFRASINTKRSIFTFSGNGQLSTPAQTQTINFTTNARGDVVSAQVATGTVPFQLDGIRVSFSAASPTAQQAQ
jgi:hypothetical protein